jgi:hypothetical protein
VLGPDSKKKNNIFWLGDTITMLPQIDEEKKRGDFTEWGKRERERDDDKIHIDGPLISLTV